MIPAPDQSAGFVGDLLGSSTYAAVRLRHLCLAALRSSLIGNWNAYHFCEQPGIIPEKSTGRYAVKWQAGRSWNSDIFLPVRTIRDFFLEK